ncbi:MAG TPA: hypothetical protein VF720_15960 [Candidatus Eisenbacteria bacterium]
MSPPIPRLEHPIAKLAGFWLFLVAIGFGLALTAAYRVGGIDPGRVLAGSVVSAAGPALLAIVVGWVGAALLYGAATGFDRLVRSFARRLNLLPGGSIETGSDSGSSVVRALLSLAGTWAAFRWLVIPLVVIGRGPTAVPLLAATAGSLLLPITVGFGSEALLGLSRSVFGRSREWILLRLALRIGWMVFLFLVITGTNLLRGDPLEWATRLGSAGALPGDWLQAATQAVGSLWPVAQVIMVGGLLIQVLGLLRETPGLWRKAPGPDTRTNSTTR